MLIEKEIKASERRGRKPEKGKTVKKIEKGVKLTFLSHSLFRIYYILVCHL